LTLVAAVPILTAYYVNSK